MFHSMRKPPGPVSHLPRFMVSVLLAVACLLSVHVALAEEFYVPLSSRAETSFVTELRIVNPSERSLTVAIEPLGPFGAASKTTRLTLAAGQSTDWSSDIVGGHADSERVAAVAIRADGPLAVTAVRRCAACGAISAVPVLDENDAGVEGAMRIGGQSDDPVWKSGFGVVNPIAVGALITVFLHRGGRVIDQTSMYIPGRAARAVSIDDLFAASRNEPIDALSFSAPRSVLLFGYDTNERSGAQFFTPAAPAATRPPKRRAALHGPPPVSTQTIVLTPSKDNTLYESSNGSLSNGAGIHLFSGMTNRRERRRALLAFDVASQIPPGSHVTSVVLKLEVSQTISGPEPMELHRVSADWGEGSSRAGDALDGTGASSQAGDATWIHTFFPDRRWSSPGGDFEPAADATALAGSGPVTWGSSATTVARVQEWLDQASTNFGWIILGDEANARTAKRFDSREVILSATRPSLTIEFKR